MEISVIAFDCDGVMFDTKASNIAYYNKLRRHLELPDMTPEEERYVHMHTVDEAVSHIMGKDPKKITAAHEYRKTMDYGEFFDLMQMEPHLKSTLRHLRPRFRTAIATNRTASMYTLLDTFCLKEDFDLVVCAHEVPRPKPHPDALLKILSHFGISGREALYIGDSALDEMAATGAGIPLVAYRNPSLDAAFHIDRIDAIVTILDRLG